MTDFKVNMDELTHATDNEVSAGLVSMLRRWQDDMSIAVRSHEYLMDTYAWRRTALEWTGIIIAAAIFVLSAYNTTNSYRDGVDIAVLIMSGFGILHKGARKLGNYDSLTTSHRNSAISAEEIRENIELDIRRNNLSKERLQVYTTKYQERVEAYRHGEAEVTPSIKSRFLQRRVTNRHFTPPLSLRANVVVAV